MYAVLTGDYLFFQVWRVLHIPKNLRFHSC